MAKTAKAEAPIYAGLAAFSRFLPIVLAAILTVQGAPVEPGNWEKLDNCRFVRNTYGDGDSFHVAVQNKELIFRLYFVDCLESDNSVPTRVDEQAKHFRASPAEAIHVGKYATEVTAQLLSMRFTVLTRYEDAKGRSAMPRYYAFVTTGDGKDLGEVLLENGLARSYGMPANPPGRSAAELKAKYDLLEEKARRAKLGIYSAEPLTAIARAEPTPTPSSLDRFIADNRLPVSTPPTPATGTASAGIFSGFEDDLGTGKQTTVAPPPATPESATSVEAAPTATRRNQLWSSQEEDTLRQEVQAGKSVDEIAASHERTPGAIKARIRKLELIPPATNQP